ncbi:methyl-accepting chemotaxis protein [Pantoea sp.]|uniref:methyl-accepting chemotaxis protein n=1 Tax=Pantoea sp. TaxID=69393 RepID=UPI0031D7A1FE
MLLTSILVVIAILLLVLIQYGIIPPIIKSENARLHDQVDALAQQMRAQLDRVEALQRSMTENVVTLKSYTLDKMLPESGENEMGLERNFFNALVKELGERIGGRLWLVENNGRVVGEATEGAKNHHDLPMAMPLRALLAQPGEGLRHSLFRTASGEHTLIAQPIAGTSWLLAIDIPSRHLGDRVGAVLHRPWPLATLLLVSTLTLLRSLHQHTSRLHEELPGLLHHQDATIREQIAHLPALVQEIATRVSELANAATCIAQKNEQLLISPESNANRVAMLTESACGVVLAMHELQQAARKMAEIAAALVPLSSRAYSYALHNEEGVFAAEARHLAQRCARSSKDLRALISDAMMQEQNGVAANNQSNNVLIEEVYTVANALMKRANS